MNNIKERLKDIKFYLVAVPLVVACWAVYAWAVALPAAKEDVLKTADQYEKAQEYITKILTLAPDRLEYKQEKGESTEFDFATVIQQYANQWSIPASGYSLQAGKELRRRGSRTRSATMTIEEIDVERLGQFLSSLLIRWPDLQCDLLKLSQTSSTNPDRWKVNLKFTYVY